MNEPSFNGVEPLARKGEVVLKSKIQAILADFKIGHVSSPVPKEV